MDLTNQQAATCKEVIMAENYAEFFVRYRPGEENLQETLNAGCIQILDNRYAIASFQFTREENILGYGRYYSVFPKLYGLMDTTNIDSIGVNRIRRQPYLNLLGQGVLIGIVDTGIDYQHSVFKFADNTSRIQAIWDQTIQTGTPPQGFYYGTEYTKEQIDQALRTTNPLETVPTTDSNGHGTFMAGIAAGNIDETNDFSGVAPLAELLIVKLKPSKQIYRRFYFVNQNAESYQETDVAMGVKYLLKKADELRRPLVICLGIGTNSGGHDGKGILDEYLDVQSEAYQTCIVVPTGNESNYGLHYRGNIPAETEYEDVEIRVGEGEVGFTIELWATAPSVFSIGFISPSGELIQKIPPRVESSQTVTFLFEPTKIYVNYRIVELNTGDELILMRFDNPSQGIWKIRVYPEQNFLNDYDLWLPIREFLSADTQFIKPNPDITITEPGNTQGPITVAAYNHVNNAIYINSGRGFTRSGRIKPDITAPGVNIHGPIPGNQFSIRSGTSIASAHAAGVAALFLEWAVVRKNSEYYDTSDVKSLMIKGAKRTGDTYPNREFGYGTLDAFGSFESLRTSL